MFSSIITDFLGNFTGNIWKDFTLYKITIRFSRYTLQSFRDMLSYTQLANGWCPVTLESWYCIPRLFLFYWEVYYDKRIIIHIWALRLWI